MTTNGPVSRCPRRRCSGFTLVELLVVSAIVVLVLGAVAAAVSAGIAVWDTARNFDSHRIDALVWLETLEMELRSAPSFHSIETICADATLVFPSVVRSTGTTAGSIVNEVTYALDRERSAVMRHVTLFPFATRPELDAVAVISRVKSLEFEGEYLETEDAEGNRYRELTSVLVTLAIGEDDDRIEICRTIRLPVRQERDTGNDEES